MRGSGRCGLGGGFVTGRRRRRRGLETSGGGLFVGVCWKRHSGEYLAGAVECKLLEKKKKCQNNLPGSNNDQSMSALWKSL